MESACENDKLGFGGDKTILKCIRDEKLCLTEKVAKINHYGMSQERNFMITNKAIYNFKKKDLKRRILLSYIKGVTLSKSSDEFVIHCSEMEYDYQYISKDKKIIIAVLSQCYYEEMHQEMEIRVMDSKSLSQFVTTKKEKKKDLSFSRMPNNNKMSVSLYLNGGGQEKKIEKKGAYLKKLGKIYEKGLTLNDFKIIKIIGKGSTSKVYLAEYKKNEGDLYAIKSIRKDQILSQHLIDCIIQERRILMQDSCPFLIFLSNFFTTEQRIYFVMPFIPGGDLYHYLQQQPGHRLDETSARFYLAQVAIALQHFHDYNTIYRDLKPENILIDEDGYIKLCDFGSSLHLKDKGDCQFTGTPEYMSPEMIEGNEHGTCTDWWSFGVLMYELLFGYPPFYDKDQDKMFNLIQLGELKFPSDIKVSSHAIDLMKKLLERNPNKRIGINGAQDIEKHNFFGSFSISFKAIKDKKITPPFKMDKLSFEEKKEATNFDDDIGNIEMNTDENGEETLAESPVEEWITDYKSWFNEFDDEDDEDDS